LEARPDSGEPVELAGNRLRTLLVRLALDAGRTVTTRQLIDAVWGDEPPAAAPNALQALISRLRRAVPELPVQARPTGYVLGVDSDSVDAIRFERLVRIGQQAMTTDPRSAEAVLDEARALWRGPALADVSDAGFAQGPVARLTELRLCATEYAAAAQLAGDCGSHRAAQLVADLNGLCREYPTRERLTELLMRTLAAAGRPAEALAAYERTRIALADVLGADPSTHLSALHLAILRTAQPRVPPVGPSGVPGAGPSGIPAIKPSGVPADGPSGVPAIGPSGVSAVGPSDVPAIGPSGVPADGPSGVPGGGSAGVPRRGGQRAATNLRASLTSFVGRDEDVATVAALLAGSRLVTLVGPGGAGKTRLATESATRLLDDYPDGVWLVELAAITDPAEIATAILKSLGLREQAILRQRKPRPAPTEPMERVLDGLRDKRLLLVLDNCEHLIGAAARLADDMLGKCTGIRVLATSREPLAVTGETLWTVGALGLPPAGSPAEVALGFAAIRLFADRGAAARPGFGVDASTVNAVVDLCRALDGAPLAIELAAARLRTMSAEQIAQRLDDRFRLLVSGSRTAMPRHQTLRAVVDWSWDLLDDAERTLLRRLSVFAGGATLAAAEEVTGLGERTYELAHALVEKSLLITTGAGEPRFAMLETIRAYGRERLADAGEEDSVSAAYIDFFVRFAETAEPYLRTRDQVTWLGRLGADHDNLHSALRQSIAAGAVNTALRLVAAAGWYWWLGGHRAEGSDLAGEVLAMSGEADVEVRAAAYAIAALNAIDGTWDFEQIYAWIAESKRLAEQIVNPQRPMLRLIGPLALLVSFQPTSDGGAALAGLATDPDPWVRATSRLMHAHAVLNLGRGHGEAEADLAEALREFTVLGERWGLSATLASLAEQASRSGDHHQAITWLTEAIEHVQALGTREDVPVSKVRLAHEFWLIGEPERAVSMLDEAQFEAELLGVRESEAAIRHERAEIARHRGQLDEAWVLLTETVAIMGANQVAPQVRAVVASSLGYLAAESGDLVLARSHHDTALSHAIYSTDSPIVGHTLVGLAHLFMHEGDLRRAAVFVGAAEGVRGARDRSLIDLPTVEQAALATLGEQRFTQAYQYGLSHTTVDSVLKLMSLEGLAVTAHQLRTTLDKPLSLLSPDPEQSPTAAPITVDISAEGTDPKPRRGLPR
jgi:predicted ATPase/DNA-binding SARP family transcriptional activator